MVSRALPRIISYIPLVDSSTWNFYVTIFVALNYGRQKYTFKCLEVVNFPVWFSHLVSSVSFVLCFDIASPIKTVEMLPFFNRIRKFSNFPLLLRLLIQPCRFGE